MVHQLALMEGPLQLENYKLACKTYWPTHYRANPFMHDINQSDKKTEKFGKKAVPI